MWRRRTQARELPADRDPPAPDELPVDRNAGKHRHRVVRTHVRSARERAALAHWPRLKRPGCGGKDSRCIGAGPIPLPPALPDNPEANLRARAFALAEGRVRSGLSSRFLALVQPTSVKEGDWGHSPPRAPAFLGLHLRRVRSSFAPGPAPSLPFCNRIVERHSWSVKDGAACGARRKRQRSTTARGYGHTDQLRRKAVARIVAAGQAVSARCGLAIEPGEPWDLDHTDDRRSYLGPSHVRCNRATAKPRRQSREW
jgi:hypothetical protein